MKIKISKEKLQKVLDNHQDSMIGLSRKLGKNDAFISQSFTRYGGEVDDVIANLICLLYDVQLADIKADTANKTDTQKAFAILREISIHVPAWGTTAIISKIFSYILGIITKNIT